MSGLEREDCGLLHSLKSTAWVLLHSNVSFIELSPLDARAAQAAMLHLYRALIRAMAD